MNRRNVLDMGLTELHGWKLRVFRISAVQANIEIDLSRVSSLLLDCVESMDPDYTYLKEGAIIAHNGRRGEHISLWHFGRWVDTPELFVFSRYFSKELPEHIEDLGSSDPLLSFYDICIVKKILNSFQDRFLLEK